MTEERLEQLVEGAAGRFDRSMNRAWEQLEKYHYDMVRSS